MGLMKRVLIVWGAWSAVALLFSIQMHFQTSPSAEPRPWGWIFAWQFSGWWTWALFTAPVCAFAAWAVRIRRPTLVIAAHIPMALLTAVACAGFEGGLKWALGLWRTPHTFLTGVWDGIGLWWTFNLLVYAMVAGLYHAWRAARLAMQEARFGDRLRVTFRVDPRAASAVVPTLLLQPLVENAIRHGVAPETSVSEIEIAATREGDRLHLSVRDNGPGVHAEPKRGNGGGRGTANTRARPLELYGPSHRFELTNAPDSEGGGALATIEIPYSDHARDYR